MLSIGSVKFYQGKNAMISTSDELKKRGIQVQTSSKRFVCVFLGLLRAKLNEAFHWSCDWDAMPWYWDWPTHRHGDRSSNLGVAGYSSLQLADSQFPHSRWAPSSVKTEQNYHQLGEQRARTAGDTRGTKEWAGPLLFKTNTTKQQWSIEYFSKYCPVISHN